MWMHGKVKVEIHRVEGNNTLTKVLEKRKIRIKIKTEMPKERDKAQNKDGSAKMTKEQNMRMQIGMRVEKGM